MVAWHHQAILAFGLQPLAYRIAEACYELRFRSAAFGKSGSPIVVYQMGKVGSSSLVATLKKLVPERAVYHVHRLTGEGLDDVERRSSIRKRAFPGPGYWEARYLLRKLEYGSDGRWSLIALTRDPVARNISGFFQSLPLWSADAVERFHAGDRQLLFEELLRLFLRDYPHHKSASWFDEEMKRVFDIDVYASEFDGQSGYTIYQNADLLVIRLEDLSMCYRQALADFLGRDTSQQALVRVNESGQKEYGQLYRQFLNWLVLPEDYLQSQYDTPYARHFYSVAELSRFRQKWSKNSS